MTINDPHAVLRDRVLRSVLEGAGETNPSIRHSAAAGRGLPSELQDLIFSPAVGTGVGSHLLGTPEHFPASGETQQ